jgi:hypothetical protein
MNQVSKKNLMRKDQHKGEDYCAYENPRFTRPIIRERQSMCSGILPGSGAVYRILSPSCATNACGGTVIVKSKSW